MPHHHADHSSSDNIKVAFLLNFGFTLIEIAGGLLTNSVAILSDALHDAGDSIVLGLSWYLAKVSLKTRDEKFSYGYKRFSLLAAFISSVVLLTGTFIILFEALPRLIYPETVHVNGMIGLAILGVIVNGIPVLRLQSGKTQNERIVRLHLLEDVLGWIAVLIVSVVMLLTDWLILDPLLSITITLYIGWQAFHHLKETIAIFLQATPANFALAQLETELVRGLDIQSIHDVHLWTLDGEYNVLSLHIVVTQHLALEDIIRVKQQARGLLKQYNIHHATIEIEYEHEQCELACC